MKYSEKVLESFKEITRIPRESGNEAAMAAFLVSFAKERGLECRTDEAGNVCIVKEASKGKENVPVLVLQGHQDMVCEKTGTSTHNFLTDPIDFVIEDGWMVARETTLGADDGIGVAAMLVLLDSDIPMGKIECVFTTSEETGMDGAFGMKKGFFTGKTMINLDSEDEGQLFIGCAGGLDTTISFTFDKEPLKAGYQVLKVCVCNGLGGHSGDEINKGRMNALKTMAAFLASESTHGLQLLSIDGGNKPNAIPRECSALIAVPDPSATSMRLEGFAAAIHSEYSLTDPDVTIVAGEAGETCSMAIDGATAGKVIKSMAACPHGVIEMSRDIPNLVETSTNLASVKTGDGEIVIVTSQRSSVSEGKKAVAEMVAKCFAEAGAEVRHHSDYPGWKPNLESRILKVCVESYRKLFGKDPEVKAIHAGLECGLFEEKFGGLDMISFGPTLRGVHAPGEKLELESLEKFTDHLVDVVSNFS